MRTQNYIKEVQILVGRIASLSIFMARSANRSLPFYKVLKNATKFEWTEECEEAFSEIKDFLASPPIFIQPTPEAILMLYLAANDQAISVALIEERSKE